MNGLFSYYENLLTKRKMTSFKAEDLVMEALWVLFVQDPQGELWSFLPLIPAPGCNRSKYYMSGCALPTTPHWWHKSCDIWTSYSQGEVSEVEKTVLLDYTKWVWCSRKCSLDCCFVFSSYIWGWLWCLAFGFKSLTILQDVSWPLTLSCITVLLSCLLDVFRLLTSAHNTFICISWWHFNFPVRTRFTSVNLNESEQILLLNFLS